MQILAGLALAVALAAIAVAAIGTRLAPQASMVQNAQAQEPLPPGVVRTIRVLREQMPQNIIPGAAPVLPPELVRGPLGLSEYVPVPRSRPEPRQDYSRKLPQTPANSRKPEKIAADDICRGKGRTYTNGGRSWRCRRS